jgi:hypothetical protein
MTAADRKRITVEEAQEVLRESRREVFLALRRAKLAGERPAGSRRMHPPLSASPVRPVVQLVDDPDCREDLPVPGEADGRAATFDVGLVDSPKERDQYQLKVNLTEGGFLVQGGMGTGRTAALELLAWLFLSQDPQKRRAVVGLDGAGGALTRRLGGNGKVVRTGTCVSATDLPRVTLTVDQLRHILDRRMLGVDVTDGDVLVLIDGLENIAGALTVGRGAWYVRLRSLIAEGRDNGIYFAATTSRGVRLPTDLGDLFPRRITLGFDGDTATEDAEMLPGHGTDPLGRHLQLYSSEGAPLLQSRAEIDARFGFPDSPLWSDVPHAKAGTSGSGPLIRIGQSEVDGEPVYVDPAAHNIVIVGGHRSGKTDAIKLILRRLAEVHHLLGALPLISLTARDANDKWVRPVGLDQLAASEGDTDVYQRGVEDAWIERVRVLLGDDVEMQMQMPMLIAIDDAQDLRREKTLASLLNLAAARGLCRVIAASSLTGAEYQELAGVKTNAQILYLQPQITDEQNSGSKTMNEALTDRPARRFAPGSGILYDRGSQVAVFLDRLDR